MCVYLSIITALWPTCKRTCKWQAGFSQICQNYNMIILEDDPYYYLQFDKVNTLWLQVVIIYVVFSSSMLYVHVMAGLAADVAAPVSACSACRRSSHSTSTAASSDSTHSRKSCPVGESSTLLHQLSSTFISGRLLQLRDSTRCH